MRLYEYEAKRIFRRYGIPVLENVVIHNNNLDELDKIFYPVVIKAQVFLGGRGKAGFVQIAESRTQAEQKILAMLGRKHGNFEINKVLLEKKIRFEKEVYIAASIDRIQHKPLIIASTKGGVDVEQASESENILKYDFNPNYIIDDFVARGIAKDLKFTSSLFIKAANIVTRVYNMFQNLECKLVEINPLVQTQENDLVALDAKIDLDEDAMFRHPELREMGIEKRHEVGELTQREKLAKAKGIPYVDLEGDIGVFPGGAGFGIAAIDLITYYNGNPANFMDSGGAPTQEKLRTMLGLLIDNPRVKAIFGARFGGISRCDDWAKALVQYVFENKPQKPMIMRMAGNMEEAGQKILEKAKKDNPELFRHIKVYAVDTPIEEVIKETIRIAKNITHTG